MQFYYCRAPSCAPLVFHLVLVLYGLSLYVYFPCEIVNYSKARNPDVPILMSTVLGTVLSRCFFSLFTDWHFLMNGNTYTSMK